MTGFAAAFAEGPVDFYKSQIQVQVSRKQTECWGVQVLRPNIRAVFKTKQHRVITE